MQRNFMNRSQPDTFICHASEDKEAIARPIHEALAEAGVYAWLDESENPARTEHPAKDRRWSRKLQVSDCHSV